MVALASASSCWRFLPLQREFLFPTVTKCTLMGNCWVSCYNIAKTCQERQTEAEERDYTCIIMQQERQTAKRQNIRQKVDCTTLIVTLILQQGAAVESLNGITHTSTLACPFKQREVYTSLSDHQPDNDDP